MIRSLAVLASATLLAVSAPTVGAATPDGTGTGAAPPPAASASVQTFTLLTGDVVELRVEADGAQQGAVVHDVAPVGDVSFQEVNGDLYALTGEAVRLVGQGRLDLELFNLTTLSAAGYDDAHTAELPVIATYDAKNARAAASVPAGTARVRALPSVGAQALDVRKAESVRAWSALTGQTGGVRKVWLDGQVTASLDLSVPAIGAPAAWHAGYDGTGVKVAVLDTGIDATHPDFAGRIAATRNFVPGQDVQNVQDGDGHGTHVASTVLGSGAASGGTYKGVAPGARLVVGKVLDDEGSGQNSEIIAGMEWAAAQGAKVINMSLGGGITDGTDPLSQAVNRISSDTGALFVIAAGNNGKWVPMGVSTPGSADRALTVGNVAKTAPYGSSESSSVGPRLADYAVKPEITAPGTDIVAARSATGHYPAVPANDRYTKLTGTSMAAPHVAGAAAVLAQQHPAWTAAELKDALVSSAGPNQADPITTQGGGMVDLRAATTARLVATGTLDLGAIEPPHPATSGEITLRNPGTEPVHADLALDLFKADVDRYQQSPYAPPGGAVTISPSSVDVPAGGSATVRISVDLAALDTASYYGRLVARDGDGGVLSRTTVSWTKDVERHRLTVRANDRAGVPANTTLWSFLHLINLDTGAYFPGWYEQGVGAFAGLGADPRVPEGRYAVLGNVSEFTEGAPYTKLGDTIGGDPELVLDRDRTVVIDARKGEQIRFATPRPSVPLTGRGMNLQVVRVIGEPGYEKARLNLIFRDVDVYVLPTSTVTTGRFETTIAERRGPEDLTMTLGNRSLAPQYARSATWGECIASDVLSCVPTLRNGRHTVADAGTGTPDELAAAGVRGRLAYVREVPDTDVDLPGLAAAAAAKGATGVLYGIGDTGPAQRVVENKVAVPVVVLPKTGAAALAAALRKGPASVRTSGELPASYVYDLVRTDTGKLPAGGTYRFEHRDLATVTAHYHADVPGTVYRDARGTGRPVLGMAETSFLGPLTRTEYVSPGTWRHTTEFPVGESRDTERGDATYTAGARVTEHHFGAPVVPLVSKGMTTSNSGPDYSSVSIGVTPFTTAPTFSIPHSHPPEGALALRYLRDGQVLCEKVDSLNSCRTAPAPGRFRIELDARQWKRSLPTTTHTVWEADGEFGPGGTELPTMNLTYDVPVAPDNTVRAGSSYRFSVHASYVTAGPGGIRSRVWVSHDGGATWTDLGRGGEQASFTVRTPRRGAESVAIRVRAEDKDGNVVDQTVTDAWRVTGR